MEQLYKAILDEVKYYVILSLDYGHSKWNNSEELVCEIKELIERFNHKDPSAIKEFRQMFSSSGSLHELSVYNGWKEQFYDFAKKVDLFPLNSEFIPL